MVGHPPTPPPPYSENPPETTPSLPPQLSQPVAAVPHPLPEAAPRDDSQASGSSPDLEAVSVSVQAQCVVEENVEASLVEASLVEASLMAAAEEEEEDEELITRRRHVTGDSGIEVCVCQLDIDEGSGLEGESDEEHRMCKVTGQDCCSGPRQQAFRQKERTPELPSQTASTSTGDHMV